MVIKNAEFLTSVALGSTLPNSVAPEIAIAGKSNVGKSSFINFLVNQKSLARTSSTPGRTRLVNFFSINKGEFYLVDLPGYGFAKVNDAEKEKWGKLIENYIQTSPMLKNVFLLVDCRLEPTDNDRLLIQFLYSINIGCTIVATKCDKLSKMQRNIMRKKIANGLSVGEQNVFMTSASKKIGKEEILARIEQILTTPNIEEDSD
ncbi:MAG: YihA family ribosome biogenesis GTP-binding protein [Clostridia bacterium]|nr:YihA family ribosome biogenesis GTP-binding protein [Clostridia bacterium]